MVLSLDEELLLIAYHEEKGTLRMAAYSKLDVCFVGALLMNLALLKRLRVRPKTLEVVDRKPTGQVDLDAFLKQIGDSEHIKSTDFWIKELKKGVKPRIKEKLEKLVDHGILNHDERKVFWFFTINCYPTRDDRPKREILRHLQTVILRGETPDPKTEMLISLVWASGLGNTVFDSDERKDANKRIKEIAKLNLIAQGIAKASQG
ncbi:GPP34 family phosphoprotein [Desulfosporosinus fructosivorans]|uniref:GPP34 family phosphoprotein n=1 Tax=Desulfosporosinus fructosivorans TaxID=2018669 RepID=A0A4Z0R600_9FIRM|nr:GPP34 family phosphoprotein [Desulfosporosinus fructosivorans]TGE38541.1 GPP34 family phosphoprotein [Desulfosporosinus fructosivorans]